jgi:hypothetical protein
MLRICNIQIDAVAKPMAFHVFVPTLKLSCGQALVSGRNTHALLPLRLEQAQ